MQDPVDYGPSRNLCSCGPTNTLYERGSKKLCQTCLLYTSPLLVHVLPCPIRLDLQDSSAKTKLGRISNSKRRALSQMWVPLECRAPCDCTGCTLRRACWEYPVPGKARSLPVCLPPLLSLPTDHVPSWSQ